MWGEGKQKERRRACLVSSEHHQSLNFQCTQNTLRSSCEIAQPARLLIMICHFPASFRCSCGAARCHGCCQANTQATVDMLVAVVVIFAEPHTLSSELLGASQKHSTSDHIFWMELKPLGSKASRWVSKYVSHSEDRASRVIDASSSQANHDHLVVLLAIVSD